MRSLALLMILLLGITGCSQPQQESTSHQPADEPVISESPIAGVTFRFIEANGLRMRIAEA